MTKQPAEIPKGKNQAEIQEVETETGRGVGGFHQPGEKRIDTSSYPATPHTHTESREPWEMSDKRNKKGG